MKKLSLLAIALMFSAALVMPAQAADMGERLKGHFLLAVQEHGELWYVHPDTGQRLFVATPDHAWQLIRDNFIGIKNVDLVKIPEAGESATAEGLALRDRLSGRFLLAVESKGEVWYVNPHDGFRHYLGTGASTFDKIKFIALGATSADISAVPADENGIVVSQPSLNQADQASVAKRDLNAIKANLGSVEYKNAALGYEFASSLWSAYEAFNRDHQNYPEIKWFENILEWNLPIYFDETGFTLDPKGQVYWKWDNFSNEFFKMYFENFSFEREADWNALMTFSLPAEVATPDHGLLPAGTYYYSAEHGFLTQEQFDQRDDTLFVFTLKGVDVDAEAERIMKQIEELQDGLEAYWSDVKGYPKAYEEPIVLGENGRTKLVESFGFHDPQHYGEVYIDHIESGSPTTQIVYDSVLDGEFYEITWTLWGETDKYEPGVYEATPYKITRVGPLPQK